MNPDILETIDYFQKSLFFSLTVWFGWDTIPISKTDTTTLSMEYTMTFSDNVQQAAKDLMFLMKNMPDTDTIELLNTVCKAYNVDGIDVIQCKAQLQKQQ